MSTSMRPNRLEQLERQLEKVPGHLFPQRIRTSERHLFHAVHIRKEADLRNDRFHYQLRHLKYNHKSFERNKGQFAKLGYGDIHILHDPTLDTEGDTPTDTLSERERKLQEREERLKEREKRLSEKEAELTKTNGPFKNNTGTNGKGASAPKDTNIPKPKGEGTGTAKGNDPKGPGTDGPTKTTMTTTKKG